MDRRQKELGVARRIIISCRKARLQSYVWAIITAVFVFCSAQNGWAVLEPDEVLVVANKKAARSVGLARHYMQEREIPEGNLLQIWVDDKERCSRSAYEQKIAVPVRRFLTEKEQGREIRCLLLMYGVPLKVSGPGPSRQEREKQKELVRQLEEIEAQFKEQVSNIQELSRKKKDIEQELKRHKRRMDKEASVDSELALVLAEDVDLSMWVGNPYYLPRQREKGAKGKLKKKDVLMVSRLDGPDSRIVKRIIKDSIQTEKVGLKGRAYFDARWKRSEKKDLAGYRLYDQSIYEAADFVRQK